MSGIVLEVMEGRTDDSVDELCHTALTKEQRNVVKTVSDILTSEEIKMSPI